MKVLNLVITLLFLISFSTSAFAQPAERNFNKKEFKQHKGLNLPDLSDDQQDKIKTLRTSTKKEMIDNRNQVGELKAKLRTLQTADNPDMNKINSTIEEISAVKTDMAKKKAAHHQDIRSILTEEQRVIFDSRPHGSGEGKERGRKHHRGNRNRKR